MRLWVLLLLAGCVRSNARILTELERVARLTPNRGADALLERKDAVVHPLDAPRSLWLPLESARLPTVRGAVNGVSLRLVLDSGASLVSLSGPAAERVQLYLPPREETRAISPGFDARYRMGVFDSLSLGALRFGRGLASVPLRDASGGAYGIVGCSVLGGYRLTLDFKARRVRFEPTGRPGRPFLARVKINGAPYRLLVDTGATRVGLEPWAALELGLISKAEASRHRPKTEAFRSGRITRVRLRSLQVAGRTFRELRAGVVLTFGKQGGPAGLLGLAGLGEVVWTLDFAAQTIRLKG